MKTEIIFLILGIILGISVSQIYNICIEDSEEYERKYNGYWISERNESKAKEFVENEDKYGNWICVNIRGMEYETMVETCKHEVGHEMFAEECENNVNKCIKAVENN